MIQADVGENIQVGIERSGWRGPHIHAACERNVVPSFVRTLEFGLGHTASGRLGL